MVQSIVPHRSDAVISVPFVKQRLLLVAKRRMRNLSTAIAKCHLSISCAMLFQISRLYSGSFNFVERTCLALYVSACSRQPHWRALRTPSSLGQRTPAVPRGPVQRADVVRSGARRANGMGNDDDNGARRNRSEPNASALGIELSKPAAALASSLLLLRDDGATLRSLSRRRRESGGGRERESVPGKPKAPARAPAAPEGRPDHPYLPSCIQRKSEKESEGEERKREGSRRRRLFPWSRPTSELFSYSLYPLFFLSLSSSHMHSLVLLLSSFTGTFRRSELKLYWNLIGCLRPCEMGRASWCGLVWSACKRPRRGINSLFSSLFTFE